VKTLLQIIVVLFCQGQTDMVARTCQ